MSEPVLAKMRGKLTKKFLFQIPTGLYLVSGVMWAPDRPIFEEKVLHNKNREEQWERILKCRVDQRLCYIFENKKDHGKWFKQFKTKETVSKG